MHGMENVRFCAGVSSDNFNCIEYESKEWLRLQRTINGEVWDELIYLTYYKQPQISLF